MEHKRLPSSDFIERAKSTMPTFTLSRKRASDKVLASIFDSLGLDERSRNELVDCILDWRDSDDVPHLYGAEVDDYGQVFLNRADTTPEENLMATQSRQ